jgi:hypothetical protein
MAFSNLIIKFETSDSIPAPFSYQVLFQINSSQSTDFQLHYTNREELSEEEIEQEGYSMNDDFSWKGELNEVWQTVIEDTLNSTKFKKESANEFEDFWEISVDENLKGIPTDSEKWGFLLQEIQQAVFETSQKEKHFEMYYLNIVNNRIVTNTEFQVHFSNRKATSTNQEHRIILDWKDATSIIEKVFLGEFLPEKAIATFPVKNGKYLNFGDEIWYQVGPSIKNPHGNKGYLKELEGVLEELV